MSKTKGIVGILCNKNSGTKSTSFAAFHRFKDKNKKVNMIFF